MSDLLGGGSANVASSNARGSSNGGSRATGPVPVPQYSAPGVRGPRDIMRERQAREARRKAELEAREREQQEDDQRRVQEERRRSAERRAVAAGVAGGVGAERAEQRMSGGRGAADDPNAQSYGGERKPGERTSTSGVPRAHPPRNPQPAITTSMNDGSQNDPLPQRTAAPATANGNRVPSGTSTRPRGPSTSQPTARAPSGQQAPGSSQDYQTQNPRSQTRPATGTGQSSQAQAGMSAAPSASQPTQPGQGADAGQGRNANSSSFPHAFERWETLSSHWEGLTSYWIRRLEQNSDEVRREPLAQQMSRQITDLSAAGANLFHAVVELQRLRASSERKFQRWFFETRSEQERAAELKAELETTLRQERAQRVEAVTVAARAEKDKLTAESRVEEMKRELQISKDEARRAWEELGRREQEEIERTKSLKDGQPTLVGGVQVLPMTQEALSRHGSLNRPSTREGPHQARSARPGDGSQIEGEEFGQGRVGTGAFGGYTQEPSSMAEDPFLESTRRAGVPARRPVPEASTQSGSAAPITSAATTTASSTRPAYPPASQEEMFGPRTTITGGGPSSQGQYAQSTAAPSAAQPAPFYQHGGTSIHEEGRLGNPEAETRSFSRPSDDATLSEDEYELDEQGNFRLDSQGRRILFRRGAASEGSDDYDVREDLERERAHAARYGVIPSTAYTHPGVAAAPPGPPDYSGAGYGSGWENVPRHHHPTRLSDVLEEDERSRTSASRASQSSRR